VCRDGQNISSKFSEKQGERLTNPCGAFVETLRRDPECLTVVAVCRAQLLQDDLAAQPFNLLIEPILRDAR
jgi:hypothetical protein